MRGSGLIEALSVLAIAGLLIAVSVPHLAEARARARLAAASREVATLFRRCRAEAISRGRAVSVRFVKQGFAYDYSLHEDTDGDGIRLSDILAGTDRLIGGPWRLEERAQGIEFSILARPSVRKIPPQSGSLTNVSDPIKFGPLDLVSFSPLGTATGGTAYLSDSDHSMAAVVLYGPTGRVRAWKYLDGSNVWVQQ